MFWKKKKQPKEQKTYDYYILAGEEQETYRCNFHYSEDAEDPLFIKICEDLICTVLSQNTVITHLEILEKQEELSIMHFLEMKNVPKDTKIFTGEKIIFKTYEADGGILEEYWKGAISPYEGYRFPRRFSLYGFPNKEVFQESLLEIDDKIEKRLYDICILYDEPPQSLEFEIKKDCMHLDTLCDLIVEACDKYGKKIRAVYS